MSNAEVKKVVVQSGGDKLNAIISSQGWNDASLIIHLTEFIEGMNLMRRFVKYAENVAKEENATYY